MNEIKLVKRVTLQKLRDAQLLENFRPGKEPKM